MLFFTPIHASQYPSTLMHNLHLLHMVNEFLRTVSAAQTIKSYHHSENVEIKIISRFLSIFRGDRKMNSVPLDRNRDIAIKYLDLFCVCAK